MNLKKITSLTMLLTMLIMSYTGIILFIAPEGRVARWIDWSFLGLTKTEAGEVHSTFMILFVLATILHIYYNLKPIVSYLKNSARELIVFTKEMIIATLLTIVFLVGTLTSAAPFENFLELKEVAKEYWKNIYGEPPYGRAELSSLKAFIRKNQLNEKNSLNALKTNSIKFESSNEKLTDIAKANSVSPQKLYEIMQTDF
ncbi:MAG: hypothetical protein C0628_02175 [Sulfurimonas sp.]|nr:MAG: hypothetical protein C0628_02175 [Sulfurimonas sp.]